MKHWILSYQYSTSVTDHTVIALASSTKPVLSVALGLPMGHQTFQGRFGSAPLPKNPVSRLLQSSTPSDSSLEALTTSSSVLSNDTSSTFVPSSSPTVRLLDANATFEPHCDSFGMTEDWNPNPNLEVLRHANYL